MSEFFSHKLITEASAEMLKTRSACILMDVAKGDLCAAKRLVIDALKKAGVKVTRADYVNVSESKSYGQNFSRFVVQMTDKEADSFLTFAHELATAGGWNHSPFDFYHD